MKFILEINEYNNAAMAEDPEQATATILKEIAWQIEHGARTGPAWDGNGNRVGSWEFVD